MNFGGPSWLLFLIAVLVILAILYLIGMRVNVGYIDLLPFGKGWCRNC